MKDWQSLTAAEGYTAGVRDTLLLRTVRAQHGIPFEYCLMNDVHLSQHGKAGTLESFRSQIQIQEPHIDRQHI